MDAEISSGDSESNTSGSAILSRKGLFGKSGDVSGTFDPKVSTEQTTMLSNTDKSAMNHEELEILASPNSMKAPNSSVEEALISKKEQHRSQNAVDDVQEVDDSHQVACSESGSGLIVQGQLTPSRIQKDGSPKDVKESHHHGRENDDCVVEIDGENDSGSSYDAPTSVDDGFEKQSSVEEIFEKKIISMDTVKSAEDQLELPPAPHVGHDERQTAQVTAVAVVSENSLEDELVQNNSVVEKDSLQRIHSADCTPQEAIDDVKDPDIVEIGTNLQIRAETEETDGLNVVEIKADATTSKGTIREVDDHDVVELHAVLKDCGNTKDDLSEKDIVELKPDLQVCKESEKKVSSLDIEDLPSHQGTIDRVGDQDTVELKSDLPARKESTDEMIGQNIVGLGTNVTVCQDAMDGVGDQDIVESKTDLTANEETVDDVGDQEVVESRADQLVGKEAVDEVSDQNIGKEKIDTPSSEEIIDKLDDQNIDKTEPNRPKRRSSARQISNISSMDKKTPTRSAVLAKQVKTVGSKERNEGTSPNAKEEISSPVENVSEQRTPRSRSRRIFVKHEVKSEPPKKNKRSTKLNLQVEDEDKTDQERLNDDHEREVDAVVDSSRLSLRRKSTRTPAKSTETPKSDTHSNRSLKEKSRSSTDKESAGSARATRTPRSVKSDVSKKTDKSIKSTTKKEKDKNESHDPYDIDTEIEKHPEPLKNIQMEVQSFGEVKYAKVGSGKYERTEKTAESRVGNLAVMTPKAKQRRSLADLTPGRKKVGLAVANPSTVPQMRGNRKSKRNEEIPMEVDDNVSEVSSRKEKADIGTPKSGARSSVKRRASPPTSTFSNKRPHIMLPDMSAEDLLAVDHPHDEHAPYEPGARVYAMFDGLFYPAIVASRDGLGRFKVSFVEDNVIKDVPPAGVIPLRALSRDKECYFSDSDQKDRVPARIVNCPSAKSAIAWQNAEFELEQLNDDGEPSGKKFKAKWTKLALSKDDWKDYINRKSREATDVITENIENSGERQLRRPKTTQTSKIATPITPKSTPKMKKSTVKASLLAKSNLRSKVGINQETGDEQIFAGKLFILTSANRPNADTGFKKKFMTDFISTHGGLVVDDMKEVDEHPTMERFLISDTHYRTHKYLAALVRAMPCVSHEWIYKCLNEKKLVDYKPFLLPSGVSILDEKEYPLPTKRGVLLRNKKVMVHSNVMPPSKKSMSFEQIWVPMVPQLGGEIVSDIPDEEGKLDILLTDHSATASMVEKARKIGCAVVSSEWLIQGIIMDRLPDVNAHQKFLHNGGVYT